MKKKTIWEELRQRLGPFLALLDARYSPLLFAVAPQAYAVFLWLYDKTKPESFWVAIIGALGYEMVYVGAIAWADYGHKTRWTTVTAVAALGFSVAVAIYAYIDQGWWSLLHAGFPLVAFCYTMQMHAGRSVPAAAPTTAQEAQYTIQDVPRFAPPEDETTIVVAERRVSWRLLAEATGIPVTTLRRKLEHIETVEA